MRKTRACAQATLTGVHQIHIAKRGSDEFTNGNAGHQQDWKDRGEAKSLTRH
jgi:hypothetical protein